MFVKSKVIQQWMEWPESVQPSTGVEKDRGICLTHLWRGWRHWCLFKMGRGHTFHERDLFKLWFCEGGHTLFPSIGRGGSTVYSFPTISFTLKWIFSLDIHYNYTSLKYYFSTIPLYQIRMQHFKPWHTMSTIICSSFFPNPFRRHTTLHEAIFHHTFTNTGIPNKHTGAPNPTTW